MKGVITSFLIYLALPSLALGTTSKPPSCPGTVIALTASSLAELGEQAWPGRSPFDALILRIMQNSRPFENPETNLVAEINHAIYAIRDASAYPPNDVTGLTERIQLYHSVLTHGFRLLQQAKVSIRILVSTPIVEVPQQFEFPFDPKPLERPRIPSLELLRAIQARVDAVLQLFREDRSSDTTELIGLHFTPNSEPLTDLRSAVTQALPDTTDRLTRIRFLQINAAVDLLLLIQTPWPKN